MRRMLILFLAVMTTLVMGGQVFGRGTTFNAVLTNDSLKADSSFFTINLYCDNKDSILEPPYENRMTWTSPFTFSGNVSVNWIDTNLISGTTYFDSAVVVKFAPVEFYNFWDLFKPSILVESWADGLPDRFSIAGIGNSNGYPPTLGNIRIMSWHVKTISNSGYFCMEKGDMTNNSFDWLFDTTYYDYPMPDFAMKCWSIEADTFKVFNYSVPVFDTIFDTLRVNEGATLAIPGTRWL